MAARGYSPATIGNRRHAAARWRPGWPSGASPGPAEVTRQVLESYQRHLFRYRKTNGQPLLPLPVRRGCSRSARSTVGRAAAALSARPRLRDGAAPPAPRLPRSALTAAEAELVLAQPDITTGRGAGPGHPGGASTPPASAAPSSPVSR